jgi:uncharacterized protein YcfJ
MTAVLVLGALVASLAGAPAKPANSLSTASRNPALLRTIVVATPAGRFGRTPGLGAQFRPNHVKNRRLERAVAGAALGMLAGGAIGYVVRNREGCDMCGFSGVMYGGAIGLGAGAAVGVLTTR